MSQLIVERTSIMAALLPSGGDPAHSPYATTHHALMCIFNCFLHKVNFKNFLNYIFFGIL